MEDAAKLYLDEVYARGQKSRRRVEIKMLKFDELQYVEAWIGSKAEVRFFRGGRPQLSYWMDRKTRLPIVAAMIREGFKQKEIATMLQFSYSTINADVRVLRETSPWTLESKNIPRSEWNVKNLHPAYHDRHKRGRPEKANYAVH